MNECSFECPSLQWKILFLESYVRSGVLLFFWSLDPLLETRIITNNIYLNTHNIDNKSPILPGIRQADVRIGFLFDLG